MKSKLLKKLKLSTTDIYDVLKVDSRMKQDVIQNLLRLDKLQRSCSVIISVLISHVTEYT